MNHLAMTLVRGQCKVDVRVDEDVLLYARHPGLLLRNLFLQLQATMNYEQQTQKTSIGKQEDAPNGYK